MEISDYSDKSFAVFGDTKPWKNNLKQLGGKYNRNLQGKIGYIFSKTREEAVKLFVTQANNGLVQQLPDEKKYPSMPPCEHQTISYKVPLPKLGQKVTDDINGTIYTVTTLHREDPFVDSIVLQDQTGKEWNAVIVCGVWKIPKLNTFHTLSFN